MRDLTAEEVRVLGCLIEKQRTTPDQYPLTLNALRNACNQTTNRDPVVDYSEDTIRRALERLIHRGWVRNASWAGSRAMKYRHLLDKQLNLDERSLATALALPSRSCTPSSPACRTCGSASSARATSRTRSAIRASSPSSMTAWPRPARLSSPSPGGPPTKLSAPRPCSGPSRCRCSGCPRPTACPPHPRDSGRSSRGCTPASSRSPTPPAAPSDCSSATCLR
ncbi:MAG: DUF480 domain-containing protein [Thermoleophilum sp.]|nr:DUF480 domain-containing protein [Thermoleophilum sp.]